MNRLSQLLSGGLIMLALLLGFVSRPDEDALTRIITQLLNYQSKRPQEKLFLHLDKPYYASGEDIWFKAYLVDGVYYQLDSSISKVMYVELLNDRNTILKRHMLYCPEGIAFGDLALPDTLKEGKYLIRAYTHYMRNMSEEFFFTKEITVFNASKKSNQPASNAGAVDLQFFPEGGNLIAGTENRIAFKAITAKGAGVDVEGEIVDDENKVVATFASERNGMGSFKILPGSSGKYTAKLKKPASGSAYALPPAQEKGYMMQVTEVGGNLKVFIYNNAEKSAANPVFFNLVGQSRGEVYFAAKGEIKTTTLTATIAKSKFPSGIAHLTMFDGNGVPQCERLVFINHDQTTRFELTPDKKAYAKREKVELDIVAKNSKNEVVQGNFSLSIYDEERLPDIEHLSTITEYLLLTSDLVGRVEDPGYYLKDKNPETVRHLDLVMLTHGWRRFTWKEVLNDQVPPITHFAEEGITLKGIVTQSLSKKPAANSKLKIFTSTGELVLAEADEQGRFYVDNLVYFDSTRVAIQTENAKGKQRDLQMKIDPFNIPPSSQYSFAQFQPFNAAGFLEQAAYKQQVQGAFEKDAKMLGEIEITGKKIEEPSRAKLYNNANATITSKDFPPGAINIFQAIRSKAPGVIIRGSPPSMTITLRAGSPEPLFLLDGTPVDLEVMNTITPEDVESVDVVTGTGAAAFGQRGRNGVLAVYTKRGSDAGRRTIGLERFSYPGFYRAREFYTPKYDVPADEHQRPDIRTTLYWNPSVETDVQGKAHVSFFTSDALSKYRIVIQGLGYDGNPGAGVTSFEVK
jgi:hypothetical protein